MISRRLFLVGSSAFVAATALPRGINEPAYMRTAASFDFRSVHDLVFGFDLTKEELTEPDRACTLKVYNSQNYDPDKPLLAYDINSRSMHRWVAMSGDELIIEHERGVVLDVQPAFGIARLDLIYNVERNPKKRQRMFTEQMLWNKGKLITHGPFPLDFRDAPPRRSRLGFGLLSLFGRRSA